MRTMQFILKRIKDYFGGGKCPKCGDWIGDDDDCCQTCGYPWSD